MMCRPKPGEDEEDILRFQEEYLRRKAMGDNVAVAELGTPVVVRVDKRSRADVEAGGATAAASGEQEVTASDDSITMDQGPNSASSSKRLKTIKMADDEKKSVTFADDVQLMDATDHLVPSAASLDSLLCDVMERDTGSLMASAPASMTFGRSFPVVYRCDPKDLLPKKSAGSSLSIFARQMLRMKDDQNNDESKPKVRPTSRFAAQRALSKSDVVSTSNTSSCVVDGTGLRDATSTRNSGQLAREIHEENLATLSGMSAGEILEQQRQLVASLDPKLLEFVKSIGMGQTKRRLVSDEETKEEKIDEDGHAERMETTTTPLTTSSADCASTPIVAGASQASKSWLHMDTVETDKLAWTCPLDELISSKPVPDVEIEGYPARFDFDGALVSREADVPTHQGLHHHGEEPEVAGYTLQELFIYGRSSILQQRVLALTTLARILERNGEGQYDECLAAPHQFLPNLLDSGLILLLRWGLDDSTESCLVPCMAAIHALLVSASDEYFLDWTFSWRRGEEQPSMEPQRDNDEAEDDDDESKLSDAELVRQDVAKGLVRMDILPRLRYVLEVLRPTSLPTLVLHSLAIVVRLARHSPKMASAVASCPRLVDTIVREFLPKSWTTILQGGRMTSVYGVPLRLALRLIRMLASTGRHFACELLRRHDIMTSLLCYASFDPARELSNPSEMSQLCLEAYRTWKVFLKYGLTVDNFTDFYPLIARQLQFYQSLCLNVDSQKKTYDCDHAAELIGLLTVLVTLADRTGSAGLSWNLVAGLQLPIELCLKKWLWEIAHTDDVTTSSSLKLIGVTCTFIATFYETLRTKPECKSADLKSRLDDLFSLGVVPFLESPGFRNQLARLTDSSLLLCDWRPSPSVRVAALPFLGSASWGGCLNPVLSERSPFPLVGHLVHALLVLTRVHSGLQPKIYGPLFDSAELANYLVRLSDPIDVQQERQSNWFARFETGFVCDLLALLSSSITAGQTTSTSLAVHHKVATSVLRRLHGGEESMAIEILKTVIFNADFIRIQLEEIELRLEKLRVDDDLAESARPSVSRASLLRQTLFELPSICRTYVEFLERRWPSATSYSNSAKSQLMFCVDFSRAPIVPNYFEYLPITDLFLAKNEDKSTASSSDERMAVVHCLQWCHLMDVRRQLQATMKPQTKFCYLAMVTLINADVFLDGCVQSYLRDCILLMAERGELSEMDLDSKSIPEVASFHDFYEQLLVQFEAVSYGDHLFGLLVIAPLQMRYPVRLRRMIWSTEHRSALRTITVRPDDLPIALSEFLEPNETDAILLDCYLSSLLSGQVRRNWCPLLYLIAIHHVHRFLFSSAFKLSQQMHDMLRRLRSFEESDVYKHLTLYKGPNPSVSLLFDLAGNLEAAETEVAVKLSQL